jgi:hypothetical protein
MCADLNVYMDAYLDVYMDVCLNVCKFCNFSTRLFCFLYIKIFKLG